MRGRLPRALSRAAFAVAVAAILVWSLAPAAWQVATALMPDEQIASRPTRYVPDPPTTAHVAALFARKPMATYLGNSARICALATLLCLLLAAPASAVLARMAGPGRRRLLLLLLLAALFPPILLLFPMYEGVRSLGWLNRSVALVVPYAALSLPLAVWILEAAFRRIPRAIGEAAILDGLGPTRRLLRIQAPLAMPSIATAGILVFIACWNEFMLALTFLTRDETKTVTAGIASVGGASVHEIPWGQLSAAVVVATLPLVVLVFLFQRRIVGGLTRGAVKG